MKLHEIFLLVLIITVFGCRGDKDEIIIKGKIKGDIPKVIEYTLPLNGICNWMLKDSVRPDSIGNFYIEINTEKAVFIKIRVSLKNEGYVIVEPGDNYEVEFDMTKKSNQFSVYCENEIAQNYYNKLPNPFHIQTEANTFRKDSIAKVIKTEILRRSSEEQTKFKKLLDEKIISDDFYNLISMDRECYYETLLSTVIWVKYYISRFSKNGLLSNEMEAVWKDIFKKPLFYQKSIYSSPWCFQYIESYLNFKEYINNDLTEKKLEEIERTELAVTYQIEKAKKYLTGKLLESYIAYYIYFEDSSFKEYKKEVVNLINQFESDYPESIFNSFLNPIVDEILSFHNNLEIEPIESIKIIKEYQNIHSFKEAVSNLKGKKIYVDVWATWCAPCKYQFQHNDELKKLLKSYNVEKLYLSIDKDEDIQEWKKTIKFYHLDGFHILANKTLQADLERIYGKDKTLAIPWFLLVDEKGNIVVKFAKKPSEIKELEKQLTEFKKPI